MVDLRKESLGNGVDGLKAIQVINAIYSAAKTGKSTRI